MLYLHYAATQKKRPLVLSKLIEMAPKDVGAIRFMKKEYGITDV
jgi:hypothetical protein